MTLPRRAAYAACLIFAIALFYRTQIGSGFTLLSSDRYDGVIGIAILEHWSNVLAGLARWDRVDYFFPYQGTLGYNDGLFLYGLVYSVIRRLGADPFLAAELTNMATRIVAFVGAEVFMRRALGVRWPYALLAAVVFTICCNMAMRSDHAQLLSVGFVPVFAWLTWSAAAAFGARAWGRAARWGSAAAIFMGGWLLTAFYMAWFTLFFTLLVVLFAAAPRPRETRAYLRSLPGAAWWALAGTGVVAIAAVLPFLIVYIPTARSTGGQSFFQVGYYSARALDLIMIGDGNPLLSRMDAVVQLALRPRVQRSGEHAAGLTWLLLGLFVAAGVHLWRTRRDPALRPIRLIALVAVFIWILTLRIGATPLWWIVWATVPGAKGLRVVVRYQIFMAAPVIAVAVWYLSRLRLPAVLSAAIAILLVAEQVTTAQPIGLDRTTELAELHAIPPPPPGCRAFAVTRARPGAVLNPEIDAIYNHNVEAMLLAEWFHIPTINGFATFNPPDSTFTHPERPDYLDRIRAYAAKYGIDGLCTLGLVDKRWAPLQSNVAQE